MNKYSKSYNSFKKKEIKKKQIFFSFLNYFFTKKNKNKFKQISSKRIPHHTQTYNQVKKPLYVKSGPPKNWKKIILLLVLFFSILSWIFLILFMPYFKINEIEIYGIHTINFEEIKEYITNNYIKKPFINNYFLIPTNTLKKDLINKYPIENIAFNKIFPYKLIIDIQEKICSIIYYNGEYYALIDKTGNIVQVLNNNNQPIVIKENQTVSDEISIDLVEQNNEIGEKGDIIMTPEKLRKNINDFSVAQYSKLNLEYPHIPIFYDARNSDLTSEITQSNILSENFIEFILSWHSKNNKETEGNIKYYYSDNINAGITVVTNNPWKILIQPRNSLEQQLENLEAIISNNEINPNEYIDLRFEEKVFWK